MVRCVGQMYGHLHHCHQDFTCYLSLLCAQYDDALDMPAQNVLSYYMRWSQSLGSCCFLWACLALGLQLGIQICYNLNWRKLMLGPQKIMRRPPSLPRLYSCLGLILTDSFIPCLPGDWESSRQCPKSWGMSWRLERASKSFCIINPWLEKNKE